MTELEVAERRLAWAEKHENSFSVVAGVALVIPYALWWIMWGRITIYSWIFPFFLGGTLCKIAFSYYEARLAVRIRALREPGLPEARLVERTSTREPEPEPVEPVASEAPEQPEPLAPGEGPRILR